MAIDQKTVEFLETCEILESPDMPTCQLLHLTTAKQEWLCLVTKEGLEELADVCQTWIREFQHMHS